MAGYLRARALAASVRAVNAWHRTVREERGDIATWLSYGLGALIVAGIGAAVIAGVPQAIGTGFGGWITSIFSNSPVSVG